VVAHAVHIAVCVFLTLRTARLCFNAHASFAVATGAALVTFIRIALRTLRKTVALILHALHLTGAVIILGAAVTEGTLNNALALDASEDVSTINSGLAIVVILARIATCVFLALALDAVERHGTALCAIDTSRHIKVKVTLARIAFFRAVIISFLALRSIRKSSDCKSRSHHDQQHQSALSHHRKQQPTQNQKKTHK